MSVNERKPKKDDERHERTKERKNEGVKEDDRASKKR